MALGPTSRFTIDEGFASSFGPVPALGCEGIPLAQIVATVHPDDRTGLATAIDEVIARGGSYAHQYRVRRADERYYWNEANGRVDHGPDGTPLYFPGVLLDLDERRAVEQERDGAIVQLPRRGSRGIRTRSNKAYLERVAPGWGPDGAANHLGPRRTALV